MRRSLFRDLEMFSMSGVALQNCELEGGEVKVELNSKNIFKRF